MKNYFEKRIPGGRIETEIDTAEEAIKLLLEKFSRDELQKGYIEFLEIGNGKLSDAAQEIKKLSEKFSITEIRNNIFVRERINELVSQNLGNIFSRLNISEDERYLLVDKIFKQTLEKVLVCVFDEKNNLILEDELKLDRDDLPSIIISLKTELEIAEKSLKSANKITNTKNRIGLTFETFD